jgi:hypothetical protein
MRNYVLVNPYIEGTFKSKVKANNSKEAASILYKNLSEHFNNAVPNFFFTIHKGGSGNGKHYHFKVEEERNDNEVNFNIVPYTIKNEDLALDKFKTKLEKFKKNQQDGGEKKNHKKKHRKHRKDDDDSSSDSSISSSDISDRYVYKRSKKVYLPSTIPFYSWWYDPALYLIDSVYIPTFYTYTYPRVFTIAVDVYP